MPLFQICLLPDRVERNTILVASGDRAGDQSWADVVESFCWPLPSKPIVQSARRPSAKPSKTICLSETHATALGQHGCRFNGFSFPSFPFETTMPDRRSFWLVTIFDPSSLTLTPEY